MRQPDFIKNSWDLQKIRKLNKSQKVRKLNNQIQSKIKVNSTISKRHFNQMLEKLENLMMVNCKKSLRIRLKIF